MPGLFLWPGEFTSNLTAPGKDDVSRKPLKMSVCDFHKWAVQRALCSCFIQKNNVTETDDSKFYLAQHSKVYGHIRIWDLNVSPTQSHSHVECIVALTPGASDGLHSFILWNKTNLWASSLFVFCLLKCVCVHERVDCACVCVCVVTVSMFSECFIIFLWEVRYGHKYLLSELKKILTLDISSSTIIYTAFTAFCSYNCVISQVLRSMFLLRRPCHL